MVEPEALQQTFSGETSRANLAPPVSSPQSKLGTPQPSDEADDADKDDDAANISALGPVDSDEDEDAEEDGAPAIDTSLCEEIESSLYCVYTLQEGDTLAGVAAMFNIQGNDQVTPWELLVLSNRPDIVSENDVLTPGQKLRIPRSASVVAELAGSAVQSGTASSANTSSAGGASFIHTVLRTETVSDIAENYGVEIAEIIAVNGMVDADALQIGQELLIPNPQRLGPPAVAAAEEPAASDDDSADLDTAVAEEDTAAATTETAAAPTAEPAGPSSASGFIWPVGGPLSSYFGPNHPLGIDIDLFANPNAAISAAASGVVTFAGGNPCCSYGYYVVIDHGNGFSTLYAHFSEIYVSVGESVSQGEVIGAGGRTGYATGNHLHFEVHLNGSIVNPTAYLP